MWYIFSRVFPRHVLSFNHSDTSSTFVCTIELHKYNTFFKYTFEFRRLFSCWIILECSFGRKGLWMRFPDLYILDFMSCLLSVVILIMFLGFLASTLVARFLLLVIDILFLRVRLLSLEKFLYYVCFFDQFIIKISVLYIICCILLYLYYLNNEEK